MAIHPIRWQGPRRIQECKQVLLAIFEAWLSDWAASPSDSIAVELSDSAGIGAGMQWWRAGNQEGAVFIALPPGTNTATGRRLFALVGADDDEVIERVFSDAWEDLLIRLGGGARKSDCLLEMLDRAPSARTLSERHGALGFVLGYPLSRTRLFVDAGWCGAFLTPANKVENAPLATRQAALTKSTVSLGARLTLGNLSLQESLGWSVGEVLVTDARSSSPVELFCAGRSVVSGILSHQVDQRALCLVESVNL